MEAICDFCHRPKHVEKDCWMNPESRNFTVTKLRPLAQVGEPPKDLETDTICEWCQRAGHVSNDCHFNPQSSSYSLEEMKGLARTRLPKAKVFCTLCHRPAHEKKDCMFNPDSPNYDPAKVNPRSLPKRRNRLHHNGRHTTRSYDNRVDGGATDSYSDTDRNFRDTPRYFKQL